MGGILGTALLVTLTRPATWLLALAAFLIRGGIVWFLIPILILPTPVGLANLVGPTIVEFVFGGPTLGLLLLMLGGAVAVVIWVVGGGLLAAAIEVELVRVVVDDEEVAAPSEVGAPSRDRRSRVLPGRTLRVVAVRLVALLPLGVVVMFGTTRIVAVTYAELTLPSSTATPIAWRVVQGVPETIVLISVVWVLGEIVAALAARRVVLGDPSIARALAGAVADTIRHPIRAFGLFAVPTAGLILVLIPCGAAAAVALTGLRSALTDPPGPLVLAVALVTFVGLWAGGLILAAAVCAWRQAAWTVAVVPSGRGTFGGSETRRPGDWNAVEPSGNL